MMTLNDLCAHLLPPDEHLKFKTLHIGEPGITLVATMTSPKSACPDCHQLASRIHSSYPRTLADVPWAITPIELRLTVRRFFCTTCTCGRQTFTERLPMMAPFYARTTTRLSDMQADTGLALGGAAGARRLTRQGLPVSRNTLLRRVRRLPIPEGPAPEVVGIDDWAWRKGHRYGTIVVDLERGCPIDVLEDRLAETVAAWLQAHREVKVVARDRAEAYGAGIRQGAPDATQVADRFHLMQNLADALEQVLSAHSKDLERIDEKRRQEPIMGAEGSMAAPVPPPPRQPTAEEKAAQRRARRLSTYEQVWVFRQQGWSGRAIADHLGIGKATVTRYLHSSTFPERQGRSDRGKRSLLNGYKDHLVKRWNEGCQEALALFHEIVQQGYRGSYPTVARYVQRLRQAQGLAPRAYMKDGPKPKVAEPKTPQLTARAATWPIMRREEKRDDEDKVLRRQLQEEHVELADAIDLTESFAQLVRGRQPEGLDSWLERAATSGLAAFRRFANGLRDDYKAVKAGLSLRWSTGPVEGQINRLKMLKRQMYGRANIDLLRQRVLLPT
jgi:transposase